jgi:hypothetical protein
MGLRAEDADVPVVHVLNRPRVLLHALKKQVNTSETNLVRLRINQTKTTFPGAF